MYKAAHFMESDTAKIVAFMQAHNFATIIANGETGLEATQIPMIVKEVNGSIILDGHIQRKTSHHNAMLDNGNLLLLFTGPHCYVSSQWYAPQNTAGTWNYMSVQIKGTVEWFDNEGTIGVLRELTDLYEGKNAASAFDAMDSEYIAEMAKAIIGFRVVAKKIDTTFKLSQNKATSIQETIIAGLEARPNDYNGIAVANEMKKRIKK